MPAESCDVLVVGGGPAGLFLGALLGRRGVDVVVLERRAEPSAHSRAIGLHPPALAALQRIGLDEAAVAQGVPVRRGEGRSGGRLLGDLSFERAWPERPFVLTLPQHRTEALLARRLEELAPGALHRGWEVQELRDENGHVHVTAARSATAAGPPATGAGTDLASAAGTETAVGAGTDPAPGTWADPAPGTGTLATWRARVVIGADGAHSRVRAGSGIATRPKHYPDTYLMGDFRDTTDDDAAVIHLEPGGVVESFPLPGRARRWVAHTGSVLADPSPAELAAVVGARTGEVLDPGASTMVSAFTVRRQLARHMVSGRRVLIGDAAHEISPIGGQGMTLGWLDALALAPLLEELLADDTRGPLQALPRFRDVERTRLRAARTAARLAELNMALGRPLPSTVSGPRDVVLRAVLRTPLRHRLARAFSMGWTVTTC